MAVYQNMSAKNRDIAICYAFARYGHKCYHCNTSLQDLIDESLIKEELTGMPRKLPVIIIENLANNGEHNDPTDPNLVPSCYPCNRNKNKHNLSQASEMEISRAKLDSLKHEPVYHTNLQNYLLDNDHICFNEMKYAGKELSEGMNEVTCMRYFNSKKLTKANTKGIYQPFPYNCGSPDCNGVHICLKNMIPYKILQQEAYNLKKEYNRQFMDGNKERFESHTATFGKQFITLREYYTQHTKLLKHFPKAELDKIDV